MRHWGTSGPPPRQIEIVERHALPIDVGMRKHRSKRPETGGGGRSDLEYRVSCKDSHYGIRRDVVSILDYKNCIDEAEISQHCNSRMTCKRCKSLPRGKVTSNPE